MIDGAILRWDGDEFDCIDCGVRVFSAVKLAANDSAVCAVCSFIREIEDPVEREALRKRLLREE